MAYTQNNSQVRNDRVRFDLMERIGVLSRKDNGWTREVNIVAWNDGPGKVDIREWDPDHKRMTKGVTLFEDEAERLTEVLARRYGLIYPAGASADEAAEEAAGQESVTVAAPAATAASIPEAAAVTSVPAAACVAEGAEQMDAAAPAMA